MPEFTDQFNDPLNPYGVGRSAEAETGYEADPIDFVDPETLGLLWNGAWFELPGAGAPPDHAAFISASRVEFEVDPAGREWDADLGVIELEDGSTPDQPPPVEPPPDSAPPNSPSTSDSASAPGEAAPATGPPQAILDHALAWAARGFRVFPVQPGAKVPPKGMFWRVEATSDPAKIRAWWAFNPNYNYGVEAGNGLLVVDLDVRSGKDGIAALAALEAEHGALPKTLTVRTPSGGLHLYLHGPDVRGAADRVAPGIDIRSNGNYVVGPGSVFEDADGSKGYRGAYMLIDDRPIAEAPPWFVLMAGEARQRDRADRTPAAALDQEEDLAWARHYLETDAPAAVLGQGNDTVFKVACCLVERGIAEDTAIALMWELYNPRCAPPWGANEADSFEAPIRSAFQRSQNRPAVKSTEAMRDEAGSFIPLPAAEAGAPPTSSVVFAGDAAAKPLVPWLIDDTLPLVGVGLLAGQSRVGKTFVALNLARAIATGGAFFSRSVRRPGGVLIAAAEAPETLGGRIRALCSHLHPDGSVDPHSLPIAIAAIHSKDQLLQAAKDAAAAIKAKFGVPLRLVIVDTVMAAYQLDKEDDAGQVTKAMKHLEAVGRAVGALALGVHHYGKTAERGARGSSAWIASSDTILAATGATDEETGVVKDRRLALVKVRDGETGDLAFFDIVGVEVGIDEDGRTRRAGLMQLLGRTKPAGGKPPAHLGTLIDAFEQAADGDHGIARGGNRFAPETYAREVFDDRVRPLFKAPSSCRKAWSDAFKFAIDTGQIVKADGLPNCYAAKPHSGAPGIAAMGNTSGVEDPNRLT
ncbi:MAG: bifunctional DNA primase/polymerase [Methylobacterium sp.]|nr:bifunctional DNA primase/polymerase [Methylobacterium sp.]